MEFILAKSAGFCAGVRRAVDMTLHASTAKEGKITTYGPLVHNPQVIELLTLRDVTCEEDKDAISEGLVIIRSHGVGPQPKEEFVARGLSVMDATCPKVGKVQKTVAKQVEQGHHVIIVGEPNHPEVKGLVGYGGENCTVITSVKELDNLPKYEKVTLLAQTTQNLEGFEKIRDRLVEMYPDAVVKNTICAATRRRQDEIRELAPNVDAMIVIGGRSSGNTRRLVDIAKEECGLPTFWIETDQELAEIDLSPYQTVGVTAGASTPSWSIDRVMNRLEEFKEKATSPFIARMRRFLRVIVFTNIYTSIAAGSLCYLGSIFQNIEFRASFFWLVFCYVLAMHVLNRFTEKGVDKFRDDPMRQEFYKRNSKAMLILGFMAMFTAIGLSIQMGVVIFLIILAASIIGILYSVKVVPKKVMGLIGFRRLKDIAASKNFFVASAWAIVSIFPLFFIEEHPHWLKSLSAFFFLFMVTGIRSVYMDLSDIANDRLVGRDSVPIVFGEKRTKDLIRILVVFLFVFLFVGAFIHILPGLAYIIAFWLLIEFIVLDYLSEFNRRSKSLVARDMLVDGHFIVAGLLAWCWHFCKIA